MLILSIISLSVCAAIILGGVFAMKLRDKLHLVLGFSAGSVIAVSFFDLIPESIELGLGFYEPLIILSLTAVGFLVYLVLDRVIFLYSRRHDDHRVDGGDNDNTRISDAGHTHGRGDLGAASLALHTFLDGISVGLAFQASPAIGIVVAAAVLAHGFSDGINVVNLILKDGGGVKKAFKWVIADAVAPLVGVIATMFFTVPDNVLCLILAFFAGSFLYIGASELIPESHHAHPKLLTTVMTIVGAGIMYAVIRLAGL